MMTTRFLAPLALLLSTGCIHDPAWRELRGGETLRLERLELRVPEEPGWRALDWAEPDSRTLRLAHVSPGGDADAAVILEERRVERETMTPTAFLEKVRPATFPESATARFEPEPRTAYSLDPRFGPLAVRGTFRIEPTVPSSTRRPETVQSLTVLPEGAEPPMLLKAAARSMRPEVGAERILDGLALRGGGTASAEADVPDVRGAGVAAVDLGVANGFVRGHPMVAAAFRLSAMGDAVRPRTGGGVGVGLSLYALGGGATDSDFSAGGLGLGVSQHLVQGRLRYGVGADLGFLASGVPPDGHAIQAALGVRAFASVDLFRRELAGLALQLQLSASTPNAFLATLGIVTRFPPGPTRPRRA